MKLAGFLACLVAALLLSRSLGAAPSSPGQSEHRSGAAVVVDGSADTAQDQALAARVAEVLASGGFTAVDDATVQAALAANGASDLGVVTTDPARLAATRNAVGAAVLVRVALVGLPTGAWSARVLVISSTGTREQSFTSATREALESTLPMTVKSLVASKQAPPEATPAPKPAARGPAGDDKVYLKDGTELTGRVLRQEPDRYVVIVTAQGQQTLPWQEIRRVILASDGAPGGGPRAELGAGFGVGMSGTFEESEAKRQAWKKRGGALASYEVRANVTGILFPDQTVPSTPYYCVQPNGSPTMATVPASQASAGGGGGGLGARTGVFVLNAPTPGKSSTFSAFRIAGGVDFSYLYFAFPVGYDIQQGGRCQTGEVPAKYDGASMMQLNVPLNLGAHVGLGGFGAGSAWRGLVLGLAYSPSYSYTKASEATEGQGNFNWAGVELTVDVTTLEALLDKQAAEAHFRFAAFLLPPLKEGWPWLLTAGFGAVWY
ncbi:MAG: hypothetical protein HYZ29_10510 [Myxococcales bacterium]|nr:hypothetical protein [Myxococcales bacterium]